MQINVKYVCKSLDDLNYLKTKFKNDDNEFFNDVVINALSEDIKSGNNIYVFYTIEYDDFSYCNTITDCDICDMEDSCKLHKKIYINRSDKLKRILKN